MASPPGLSPAAWVHDHHSSHHTSAAGTLIAKYAHKPRDEHTRCCCCSSSHTISSSGLLLLLPLPLPLPLLLLRPQTRWPRPRRRTSKTTSTSCVSHETIDPAAAPRCPQSRQRGWMAMKEKAAPLRAPAIFEYMPTARAGIRM